MLAHAGCNPYNRWKCESQKFCFELFLGKRDHISNKMAFLMTFAYAGSGISLGGLSEVFDRNAR